MKRPIRILALALLLLAGGSPRPLLAADQAVLRIFNWEEYLDPELAAEFGRRHGVRIEETYFESDTERDRRLAGSGASGFDLVVVDQAQLPVYRDRGWIAPIDAARVPGLRHYDPRWRRAADGSATHAVPFAWGTTGIAYRADLLRTAPTSWLDLFRPAAGLCGKVMVFDDPRELTGAALKAIGLSANSAEPGAYAQVERLLKAQRPCVARYGTPGVDEDSEMLGDEVWAAMNYSSNANQLRAINPNIRFVLPKEGGLFWVDYLAVLSASKQKPLAFAFLEFLSDPAVAVRVAEFAQAATPNLAARALLPVSVGKDQSIYPSAAVLDTAETVAPAAPATAAIRNQIVARIVRKK
ncbi:MAG: spermidine/putrescine ABC transporter substrate-binding protein [Gammaproteobacteria bacterium]|nr:spermidine/putrescine ABC transporter substrate-binding protein [Gammaproteobacteria bacterium]